MNKKFGLTIIALVVTINIGFTNVYADPASDRAKIQQVQTQRNDLENKIGMMDHQIEKIMSKISINEDSITKTQKNIKRNQINIAKAEDNIKEEQILFDKRMRVMYMNGSSGYIDVVLGSTDVADLISRLEDIKTIVKFDQDVINDLKTKQAAINLKKVALATENTTLLSLRDDNKKKLTTLTKQKSDQTVLVAQLNAEEKQYAAQLKTDEALEASKVAKARQAVLAAERATAARNAAATNQSPATSSVTQGSSTFSSSSLLAYASNFLGVPYVWGGTSPSGFDCSGFTQYVFAHFGVDLPRVSEDQQNVGTLISRDNLQPGDLVFFGTPAHHVGIYVGDGNMINAPHTGAVLRTQPLNSDFTYGRRVN
ncbi:C40 family peptidase [Clostridium bowmanii]|uniref:C40 family peptidase n=1 Tax=Clostridium bowmanii TaxID=132925 RepID=UPI001C0AE2AD|nr:NlpC/P60 family protein [Clostridium bowmanii]MBU3189579.1 C40 family peptidase [Clostridium bowmanii]MCA1073578.1 C40 family peptidase [Clostridium bowmanii]